MDSIIKRKDYLYRAINKYTIGSEKLYLVITGDLTNSGTVKQFQLAKQFQYEITKQVQQESTIEVHQIVVPGNHDCDFEAENLDERQKVIDSIQINGLEGIGHNDIEKCVIVQNNFFKYRQEIEDTEQLKYADNLYWNYEYCSDAFSISFHCYNSSWISQKKEDPHSHSIFFPIDMYTKDQFKTESNVIVSAFHHSLPRFDPNNHRAFVDHLENTAHIILTGHDHISGKSMRYNLEDTNTYYYEGDELQDRKDPEYSGFNVILIDFSEKRHKFIHHVWNGTLYDVNDDTGWVITESKKSVNKKDFVLDENFVKTFINNIGAQIRSNSKENVTLQDLYVFPSLRDIAPHPKRNRDFHRDVREADLVCKIKENGNKILITGSRHVGKTSLCKMAYQHYHNNNYLPVYIKGNEVRSTSIYGLNKVIETCFQKQYSGEKELFAQEPNKNKILIIDDFDESPLSKIKRMELLSEISKYYPNVLITDGELFSFDDVLLDGTIYQSIEKYEQYEIIEFGFSHRSRLINRWISLGAQDTTERREFIRQHDELVKIFNTIIGSNSVPAYPIYLLILLQAAEMGRPLDLEKSTFGHYYQYLIYDSLEKVINKPQLINAYITFLTDLSYAMFKVKAYGITKDDFIQFHSQHCKKYAIGSSLTEIVDLGTLIKNLISTDILEEIDGVYNFKFSYIFNYFAAKYLADKLSNPDIRIIITNMCERMYYMEFADILLFLTHHSKDQFILDEILKRAKSLFNLYSPVTLENDIVSLNKLLGTIPKRVLGKVDVDENRNNENAKKDEKQYLKEPDTNDHEKQIPDVDEPLKILDLTSELNVTIRTIDILGQILKNYVGSLEAPIKLSIGEEAYNLGLRALKPVIDMFEKNPNRLILRFKTIMERQGLKGKTNIENIVREMVFELFKTIIFGFIKTISNSVGSEELSVTNKEILIKYDTNSFNLIDASIKLDNYSEIPFGELKKLKKRVRNKLLPFSILRELIYYYIYMFDTTAKQKQRLCDIGEITMADTRFIDYTSTQKKLTN